MIEGLGCEGLTPIFEFLQKFPSKKKLLIPNSQDSATRSHQVGEIKYSISFF